MKKILTLIIVASTICLNISCKKTKEKVDELTEFDMSYSSDFIVPSNSITVSSPADFTTPDIPTNSSATFANQKTISSKVTEIKLTKFEIVSTTGNFDYLKSITLYIQAAGQPDLQIATKTVIPTGVTTVAMDLSGSNVKDYLFGTAFKLKIHVEIDGAIAMSQGMKLNETMHAKAVLIN